MDTKIMKSLHDILSTFGDKYLTGKELNKARIVQDIDRYDEELIMALLSDDLIKKHYAKKIGEYTIIETNKLIETFEMDDYWMDSYTKYSKKIGLTAAGRFLDESIDVVLDFPYKDSILKAGMSKEDITKEDLMPNEPFFNEVMTAEEIDTLLDKKVLVNAKRYTTDGIEDCVKFIEEDNLIVKGNNLLALHSLKDKYAGKVKLIYIDPPYNTNKDSFEYNDNFNHSTWLVFMKNRLEIAKNLLSNDGLIFIHCDDNEQAYLKVLCDETFGRNNFITSIAYQGLDTVKNDAKYFSKNHEYLLCYSVDKTQVEIYGRQRTEEHNKVYKNPDNDPRGRYLLTPLHAKSGTEKGIYTYTFNNGITWNPPKGTYPRFSKNTLSQLENDNRIYFGKKENSIPQRKTFLSEVPQYITLTTFWDYKMAGSTRNSNKEISNLDLPGSFSTSKPEKLLKLVIESCTKENDIVLDFFMGSSTTQAVAHKMNRRYIGIEQMDYINTVSVPRLQKVMEGEQGGISKDVNWQGGGSFVYVEMMEKSKGYLQDVLHAPNLDRLNATYQLMLENVDLDFRADLESVQEMLNNTISLEDKKRLLIKVIDKNQLYYNYDEIDDANVRELISDVDYAFNQSFYEEDGDGHKDS